MMEIESVEDIWKSERLSYRAICQDDYDWVFHEIDSDPTNTCLATPAILAPPRPQKPEEWIQMFYKPDDVLSVVVCLRSTADRIGFLSLSRGGYGTSPHSRACRFGITLTAPHRGAGYGTEATRWALDWAFRHANMHSVNLGSVSYNTRAHRCYEKCGFRLEGRRRQCFWHDRQWHDLLLYGILEDEWEEVRKDWR